MTALYDELEEMVSYRKNVTGVDHTLFISPRGNSRHEPRVKIAIDPPHSIDPRGQTAAVTLDGLVVIGPIPARLLTQVRRFVAINRDTLLAYWNYEIDTDELRKRLKGIDS
jgi:hypothetical protein